MSKVIIFPLLALFGCSSISCKKNAASGKLEPRTKPGKITHFVSKPNDNEYTEEEVKEFFKQQNLKTREIVAKFGEPAIKSERKEQIQFDYIFDNFYKPKPSEGEFCGMKVYFDMDGNYLKYSSLY